MRWHRPTTSGLPAAEPTAESARSFVAVQRHRWAAGAGPVQVQPLVAATATVAAASPPPTSALPPPPAEIFLAQQKQKQQAKAMQQFAKQRMFTSFTSEAKWREVDEVVSGLLPAGQPAAQAAATRAAVEQQQRHIAPSVALPIRT